jgi:hypothetical protein
MLFLSGCGPQNMPTYPVQGKVVFPDGKPLNQGWVSFRCLDVERPPSSKGQIQPDGTFVLTTFQQGDGAIEGRHQVLINVPISPERDDYKGGPPPAPPIDGKYANYNTSGLEFTVSTDPEKNKFELQVTPPQKALTHAIQTFRQNQHSDFRVVVRRWPDFHVDGRPGS